MSEDVPVGTPFSQVYLRPTAPLTDSPGFRNRLAAYVLDKSLFGLDTSDLVRFLKPRMGAKELHTYRSSNIIIQDLIRRGDPASVLDGITHMSIYLLRNARSGSISRNYLDSWEKFVERLFEEESLGYVLDKGFGVQYKIDLEFEQVRLATIAYLGDARYMAVLHEFEAAYSALEGRSPDTKLAVRSIFEAIETLFRLLVGRKATRLGSAEIKKYLLPLTDTLYGKGDLSGHVVRHLGKGLAEWVDGLHAYRHGQPVEEPSPPPMEAAIAVLQTGSAYIRLLIEVDRKVHGG